MVTHRSRASWHHGWQWHCIALCRYLKRLPGALMTTREACLAAGNEQETGCLVLWRSCFWKSRSIISSSAALVVGPMGVGWGNLKKCLLYFKLFQIQATHHCIVWANVDPDLCHHLASVGHNELTLFPAVTLYQDHSVFKTNGCPVPLGDQKLGWTS